MSEIERVQRTFTLQLSDKDKEIDMLKQKLEGKTCYSLLNILISLYLKIGLLSLFNDIWNISIEIRQKNTEDLSTYLYKNEGTAFVWWSVCNFL